MRFGLGRAGWVDVLGWNKGLKVPRFDVTGDALTVGGRIPEGTRAHADQGAIFVERAGQK